jgi:hypothetical protein
MPEHRCVEEGGVKYVVMVVCGVFWIGGSPVLADQAPLGIGEMALEADAVRVEKSMYSLLQPTPRSQWRPMSADRPDFTESPYTVDAGAVQLEMSFFDYAKSGTDHTWTVAPINLKLGLLNDVDLQFVYHPYAQVTEDEQTTSGFGDDFQFRLKINLWGNDGGETAMAFMPFLTIPTGPDDDKHLEGGLIFPFGMDLCEGVGLGLMFETDFVYDTLDDGYDTDIIGTAVIGFDVTERIGVYCEGISIGSTDHDVDFRGILGVGGTYTIDGNLQLDAGVNIGLAGKVDDVNVFAGITVRF